TTEDKQPSGRPGSRGARSSTLDNRGCYESASTRVSRSGATPVSCEIAPRYVASGSSPLQENSTVPEVPTTAAAGAESIMSEPPPGVAGTSHGWNVYSAVPSGTLQPCTHNVYPPSSGNGRSMSSSVAGAVDEATSSPSR